MTIARVQNVSTVGGIGTSFAKAFNSNNTLNNFLYCSVHLAANSTTCVVTDTNSNSWVEIEHIDQGANSLWHFYAKNCVGGPNTVTVTQGTSVQMRFGIAEYSGVDIANPIDAFGAAGTGVGTALTAGPITTSFSNDLMIACARWSSQQVFTAGTNFTTVESQPATPLWGFEDFISSDSPGAESATATIAASATWAMLLVAIQPQQNQTPIVLVPNTTFRLYEYLYTC